MTIIEFPELKETTGQLNERRKRLHDIFTEAGPEMDMAKVKSIDGDSAGKVEALRALNDEIDSLATKREDLLVVAKAAGNAGDWREADVETGDESGRFSSRKSLGDRFGEAGALVKGAKVSLPDFDTKALFQTTDGWAPESVRGPRLVDYVQAPINILDLIPTTTTTQSTVKYMEETVYTNAAAETAEGVAKPEATLKVEEKSSDVRKIPVWLHVTDEQLEDEPRAREYVTNRLPRMVRQRLAGQVLVGDGTPPNISGILDKAIQTQAKGSDPTPDAVYKAMVKVMVNGEAMPDAFVVNPLDWQDVRLLRTTDGIYIWGSPADVGPDRIWGLRAVLEQRLTQNTGLVGDFGNYTEIAVKKGLEITTGWINDDFIKNQQVVLAEMRAAFILYRLYAMCSVTGI